MGIKSVHHGAGVVGGEDADVALEVDDDSDSEPPLHRLCPAYAEDINSPLRHVRTRIYFTSESHVHSLINVLRYCHLGELQQPYNKHLFREPFQILLGWARGACFIAVTNAGF